MADSRKRRVMLVDDHTVVRAGLCSLLAARPDVEVVGEASDGLSAVRMAQELEPDLIVMDVSMPGVDGIEATTRIVEMIPDVRVICLSMHAERRFVDAAIRAGASGYILKDAAHDELSRAIDLVLEGHGYLSPRVLGGVLDAVRSKSARSANSAYVALTTREREVLQLIAEGLSTKAIAAKLHLSVKTIGTHRENLMNKLEIRSIAGLTKYAIREGLTSVSSQDDAPTA